ncbi:MAG TPA: trigger factor [Candidatus Hydrogenedentes bacterium]|nr:trigger factor [Candidatus Hydrogenedentota bacterium]
MSDQEKNEMEGAADAAATTEDPHEHEHDHEHDHEHEHGHKHGHEHEKEEEEKFEFVEEPSFDVNYKGDCAYEVKVSIAPSNEKKQAEKLLDDLQEDAEMPGFRKGRAPRRLLEKKFGKALRGDATEKLISAAFKKLVEEKKLRPIQTPQIDGLENVLERPEDAPLSFTMSFEVAPKCELGKYRGIALECPIRKVEEKDITDALDRMRNRFALYEPVDKRSKAKEGDQVIIDFKGTVDGQEFAGGAAESYPYILGSKRFFPEFETALLGVKPGQEVNCTVAFPGDYSNAQLAGKNAEFIINVSEVKRKKAPELNDEFAKMAGVESAEALKERVSNDLRKSVEDAAKQVVESRALQAIIDDSTFELPKSLVKEVSDDYYDQELKRLREVRMPHSEIEAKEEEIRKDCEARALRSIKSLVAINEIGAAEGVEVTEEDFEKEAEAIVSRTGMGLDVVKRYLSEDKSRDDVSDRIFRQKTVAIIVDNAQVTHKELSAEDWEKELENV